jgi:potassium uptake TrkH family protein
MLRRILLESRSDSARQLRCGAMVATLRAGSRSLLQASRHPARAIVIAFGLVALIGAGGLMLPVSSEDGTATGFLTALFTATSALCVTGLVIVDTSGHWSWFGEILILALIQAGGFGIMTMASLLGLLVSRRLGLRMQLTAQAETKTLELGDVRRVVVGIVKVTLLFELATAAVLFLRLMIGYGSPAPAAAYSAVFHAVSAFNNAGFSLYPDSLIRFVADPWICLPIALALIVGGLGFPVLFQLRQRQKTPRRWTMHTKITLTTTGLLIAGGALFVTAAEWTNPKTLGSHGVPTKLLAGFFHGVTPRTAGFNTLDVAELRPATLFTTDILMFIGGGSASTAGGIKVTTFALLAFVIMAEVRGEPTVHVMRRRLPDAVQRQALTVALLSVGAVVAAVLVLQILTEFTLDEVLFEVISAFATVGLSTGITADLPPAAHALLTILMFVGRLGPITLASALAMRERPRRYELPEERPIVG